MTKTILFCATVDYHFKAFHLPYFKWFKQMGWKVHVAASGQLRLPYVDEKFSMPIQRSPFHSQNLAVYQKLKQLIETNEYDIIHCHTPVGGVLAALRRGKRGEKERRCCTRLTAFTFAAERR